MRRLACLLVVVAGCSSTTVIYQTVQPDAAEDVATMPPDTDGPADTQAAPDTATAPDTAQAPDAASGPDVADVAPLDAAFDAADAADAAETVEAGLPPGTFIFPAAGDPLVATSPPYLVAYPDHFAGSRNIVGDFSSISYDFHLKATTGCRFTLSIQVGSGPGMLNAGINILGATTSTSATGTSTFAAPYHFTGATPVSVDLITSSGNPSGCLYQLQPEIGTSLVVLH